jgi:hypothetical protein
MKSIQGSSKAANFRYDSHGNRSSGVIGGALPATMLLIYSLLGSWSSDCKVSYRKDGEVTFNQNDRINKYIKLIKKI